MLCDDTVRLDSYEGYGWLLEKPEVITALLRGESVPADFEGFQLADSALPGWNYIKAQDDIDSLMELTHEFHDSCLERLDYISGAHVHEDGSMYPIDDVRSLKMVIGSQQCNPIELVFEGLIGLNLRPAKDNYDSIILRAVLSTKNETVFFADVFADDIELESGDLNEYCTCVSAFSLRWRFLGRKATVPDSPR